MTFIAIAAVLAAVLLPSVVYWNVFRDRDDNYYPDSRRNGYASELIAVSVAACAFLVCVVIVTWFGG